MSAVGRILMRGLPLDPYEAPPMTPEDIEFLATIEEMRAPAARIKTWADHIQSGSQSPMADEYKRLIDILQSSTVELQKLLATITELRLVPVDDTLWGMVVCDMVSPLSIISQAVDLILDGVETTPPDQRPDWSTDLEYIKSASAYVLTLRENLLRTLRAKGDADSK